MADRDHIAPIALQALGLGLAFGVGLLLGGRACAPEAQVQVEERVVEKLVERPPTVCECSPDAGAQSAPAPDPAPPAPSAVRVADGRRLPEAAPGQTPVARRRLLAWVRDQSVDLRACRDGAREAYRLSVTLRIGDDGEVTRVTINAPPGEVPGGVAQCLRGRMSGWTPPADMVEGRRELVFGLTI